MIPGERAQFARPQAEGAGEHEQSFEPEGSVAGVIEAQERAARSAGCVRQVGADVGDGRVLATFVPQASAPASSAACAQTSLDRPILTTLT
ncbi:MAG TPA: hypothetical protein VLW50_32260 [Streptosporangiaceae bacterium]|nr:hypothetical protein [Streptosporangiaceae bacterium]